MIDIEGLLAPVDGDTPAGPDLAYDPDFIALEAAAKGKSEQQFGDTVIAAEEPDWRDVSGRAEGLLARSKDMRVAILAARAATRMENVEGLASGLQLIRELVSRYWDSLHPDLDHDDGDDPTMRLNALAPLADPETFLRDVRNAYLVASPQHGRVAIRDILIAENKLPPTGEASLSRAEISGIVQAASADDPAPLQAAVSCVEHAQALESFLGEKGVLTQAPDLRPLLDILQSAAAVGAEALRLDASAPADADEGGSPAAEGAGSPRNPGQINSREDAIRALEKVCEYIEKAEPANPAPLFIRRAQRLMTRNFMEIIQDLAPDSLAEIQKLAGLEQK